MSKFTWICWKTPTSWLTGIAEQDDRYLSEILQQDGVPPHYAMHVTIFKTSQAWIGKRGTTEWLASSPDLPPMNFFVGTLKHNKCIQLT